MTDPRTTALRHLPLHDAPPSRLTWSVVSPDPSGRVQLPASVVDLLDIDWRGRLRYIHATLAEVAAAVAALTDEAHPLASGPVSRRRCVRG